MNKNNYSVLMAGGVGSRFWPVSTTRHPKQFRDLLGTGETLIQTTFKRLSRLVPSENIYILTNEAYLELVREQLPEVKREQIVLEPAMRNTAPAVLVAALKIRKRSSEAVMLMAPSDHWIEDEKAFVDDINMAFESARTDERIVTLGITPTFPNTGYGYIKSEPGEERIRKVDRFAEKPDYETARAFLREGNYSWNAGIFIWSVSFILKSFRRNLPEMYDLFSSGEEQLNSLEEDDFIKNTYPSAQDISIDYGILEKEKNIYMIPASFDWNDLGTWGSIYSEVDKDDDKNAVLNARVVAGNATGNIISSATGRVIIVEDLSDFIIIDENEVVLIVPKTKEQEIKQIRAKVQKTFGQHLG